MWLIWTRPYREFFFFLNSLFSQYLIFLYIFEIHNKQWIEYSVFRQKYRYASVRRSHGLICVVDFRFLRLFFCFLGFKSHWCVIFVYSCVCCILSFAWNWRVPVLERLKVSSERMWLLPERREGLSILKELMEKREERQRWKRNTKTWNTLESSTLPSTSRGQSVSTQGCLDTTETRRCSNESGGRSCRHRIHLDGSKARLQYSWGWANEWQAIDILRVWRHGSL